MLKIIIDIWNWLIENQAVGSLLGVFTSVGTIEILLPLIRKRKVDARERLKNFYVFAYSFVMVRQNLKWLDNGDWHTKDNCGYFHSWVPKLETGKLPELHNLILSENALFNTFAVGSIYVDKKLSDLLVQYLNKREIGALEENSLKCKDQELILLRRKIEDQIVFDFKKYRIQERGYFFELRHYIKDTCW